MFRSDDISEIDRYRPSKLPLSCEIVDKTWFLGPRFLGGGYNPDFGHCIFKSHLLANMRPVLVEFLSVSSEGR